MTPTLRGQIQEVLLEHADAGGDVCHSDGAMIDDLVALYEELVACVRIAAGVAAGLVAKADGGVAPETIANRAFAIAKAIRALGGQ